MFKYTDSNDVINHLYTNKGYRWYVINKNNSKILGPFNTYEEAEISKEMNCYIQFMDEKTADLYEYPPEEYI